MAVYSSVIDLIGNTPMVDISVLSPNPKVRILTKLEGQNPGGSVKDRAAKFMILEAERKGLLEPARTQGGSRRYSEEDIALLLRIQELTEEGMNLAGVKRVLALEARIAELEAELADARENHQRDVQRTHKQYRRDLVPLSQQVVLYGEAARMFRKDG